MDQLMEIRLSEIIDNASRSNKNSVKESSNKKTKKYTQEQIFNKAYSDLEKKYPNYNSFSQDKQNRLLLNYLNDSGLYEYL